MSVLPYEQHSLQREVMDKELIDDMKAHNIEENTLEAYRYYRESCVTLAISINDAITQVDAGKRYRKQRNILTIISIILVGLCVFFAIRPTATRVQDSPSPSIITHSTIQRYVASKNSDKYHIPTCLHAQNILSENRVYYSSEIEAQRDGKTPCSVCLP